MENNEKLLKLIAAMYTESENEQETIRKEKEIELERIQKEKAEIELKLKNAEHKINLISILSFILLAISLLICAFIGKYSIDKAYEFIGDLEIKVIQDTSENYNFNNDKDNNTFNK